VGGYSVDPGELQRCDALLGEAAGRTRAALAEIHERAVDLLVSGWHGRAATAFRLGWEQWFDGVTAMLEALDEMAAVVGSSGVGYAAGDEAVRTSLAMAAT